MDKRPHKSRATAGNRQRTEAPPTRGERKQRTRHALIQAALSLMAENRSFTSLSLREVAREAGVVPNAFYRHFSGLDALGLALLDEGGLTLRRLLRQVRETRLPDREIVRRSVEVYVRYVRENRPHFLFVIRERAGGSAAIREGIRREVAHVATEMAADFGSFGVMPNLSSASRLMMAQIVVQLMLAFAVDILDLPERRADLEAELVERLARQLVVVFIGARAWQDSRSTSTKG